MRAHCSSPPFATAIAVLLASCSSVAGAQNTLWTSEGYGYFFDAGPDTLRAFEVTSISCILSFTAASVPAPAGAVAAYRFVGAPVTVLLLPDQKSDGMRFHLNGAASVVVLRRAAQRPVVCARAILITPIANFNVSASTSY